MITIKIGNAQRDYKDFNKDWLAQQIHRRRLDNQEFSVEILIHKDSINLLFSTPGPTTTRAKPGYLNPEEKKLSELWQKLDLNNKNFDISRLIDFLNAIGNLA